MRPGFHRSRIVLLTLVIEVVQSQQVEVGGSPELIGDGRGPSRTMGSSQQPLAVPFQAWPLGRLCLTLFVGRSKAAMRRSSKWGVTGSAVAILAAGICLLVPFCAPALNGFLKLCLPIYRILGKAFRLFGYYGDEAFGVVVVGWYICCAVLLGTLGFVAGYALSRVSKPQ